MFSKDPSFPIPLVVFNPRRPSTVLRDYVRNYQLPFELHDIPKIAHLFSHYGLPINLTNELISTFKATHGSFDLNTKQAIVGDFAQKAKSRLDRLPQIASVPLITPITEGWGTTEKEGAASGNLLLTTAARLQNFSDFDFYSIVELIKNCIYGISYETPVTATSSDQELTTAHPEIKDWNNYFRFLKSDSGEVNYELKTSTYNELYNLKKNLRKITQIDNNGIVCLITEDTNPFSYNLARVVTGMLKLFKLNSGTQDESKLVDTHKSLNYFLGKMSMVELEDFVNDPLFIWLFGGHGTPSLLEPVRSVGSSDPAQLVFQGNVLVSGWPHDVQLGIKLVGEDNFRHLGKRKLRKQYVEQVTQNLPKVATPRWSPLEPSAFEI